MCEVVVYGGGHGLPTLEAAARHLKRPSGERRIPRLWLFTDPLRLPDPRAAARRLPRGAGIVARGLAPAMLVALARMARQRGLVLLVGGDPRAALALQAGLHLPDRPAGTALLPFLLARRGGAPGAMLSLAAHGRLPGRRRAGRLRPDLVFLSPVFPTPSHPGAPALGPIRWALTARALGGRVAALGGVSMDNSRRISRMSAGFGAIGALS